jgi:hypothetical protein
MSNNVVGERAMGTGGVVIPPSALSDDDPAGADAVADV